jgi:uncharacterized protein
VCPLRVTDLATYPVKSCAGIHLQEARVTPRGLEFDRDFMVIDDEGDFISQRKVPELALIVPTIGESSITLAAPGMENAELPLEIEPDDERLITATVHGRTVAGQIVGEDVNEWFTTFLPPWKGNRRFRLLRVREDVPRYIKSRYQQPGASNRVGFADANSILLASERSLAKLNEELEQPVPMNRFRPNIVLDGDDLAPYEEDYWIKLQIGALAAFVVKACDRCVIPDIDQDTAVTRKAVRRALRTRKGVNAHDHSQKGVFFAQNLNHVYKPGVKLSVGDPVGVIERGTDPNVLLEAAKLNVA